jgi:hypothetical protein
VLHRNRALLLVQTELVLVLDGDLLPQVARRTNFSIGSAKCRGACSRTDSALQGDGPQQQRPAS